MRLSSNFINLSSRALLLLLFFLPLPRLTLAGTTITQTLFGPERFNYSSSTYTRTFSCPSTQGSFTLKVVNGDGDDDHFSSSAVIKVNNVQVVGTNDLNSNTKQVSKTVSNLVNGSNTLTVKVNGHSGDYLTVTISGVYTLDVKITSPVSGAQLTANHTSVQGTYLAYTSNFSISVDNVSASAASGNFNVPSIPLVSGGNLIRAVIATTDGLTDQDNVTVNDNLPPIAKAGSAQTVRTGDNVVLDGRVSSDPENSPISYQWSIAVKPSGSQSTLAGPNTVGPYFVPDLAGSYIAQLIVNDGVQNSLPDNISVTAVQPNTPPTAVAGADQNVSTGNQVFLDGYASFDPDSDPITYAWSMTGKPQQSQAVLSNPVASAPTFVADENGAYLLELVVNDGQANSLPDNVTIVAVPPNVPPTAFTGLDALAPRNQPVHLDGSGSFDPEEQTLSYSWILVSRPEGSSSVLADAATVSPTFLPDLLGDYVFRLIVNDGVFDSDPDSLIVTAINVPPVAVAIAASNDAPVNTVISLDGTGSDDENNDPITYSWSLTSAPTGSTASVSNSTSAFAMITPDVEGSYTINLVVNDGQASSAPATVVITAFIPPVSVPNVVGMSQASAQDTIAGAGLTVGTITSASSDTVPSGNVISQSPTAGSMIPPGSAVNMTVSSGPLMVPVPVVLGMTQTEAQTALVSSSLNLGTVTNAYSGKVASGRVISQNPPSGTSILHGSSVAVVVSQGPEPVMIPPDPITVAPPRDKTVTTTVAASSAFLYSGADPIQRDVVFGTIDQKRVSVLRGYVRGVDGQPLPGVAVSVHRRPEFGKTSTRSDGMFDMAVNGGEILTVSFEMPGYLSAHRKCDVPWQDYIFLPDVVLVPYDNQVTSIDLNAAVAIQAARGSMVSDERGTRQATVLLAQGTGAQAVFPDGSVRPLSTLGIRATEFTVGANGEKRMPAPLPPATAYTYAVDLSVDEALEAGAAGVSFDRPVYVYVENFLNFPVGIIVPAGYYDTAKATWIPSENGRVVKIVGVSAGKAEIDSDGDGTADNSSTLATLGITDVEREKLANLYEPGNSLWRVPITHFSIYDFNWPYKKPGDARSPDGGTPTGTDPCDFFGKDSSGVKRGSILYCPQQILGETIPITGTPFALNYRSSRVPGWATKNTITIPLTGSSIPESLARVYWEVIIGGHRYSGDIPPDTDCTVRFPWDGRGYLGIPAQGIQRATIRVGFGYDAQYYVPPEVADAFGISSTVPMSGTPSSTRIILWQTTQATVGGWDARAHGLGGWTLDLLHTYDPVGQTLFLGNGSQSKTGDVNRVVGSSTGGGGIVPADIGGDYPEGTLGKRVSLDTPWSVAVGADDSLYIADTNHYRVLRQYPDGTVHVVAGSGIPGGSSGSGGLAINATLGAIGGVAVGPDNTLYLADSTRNLIWRVENDGTIRIVAGGGNPPDGIGDGLLATQASLYQPTSLSVNSDGSFYIADTQHHRVRYVTSNGIISTFIGGSSQINNSFSAASSGSLSSSTSAQSGPFFIDSSGRLELVDPHSLSGETAAEVGSSVPDENISVQPNVNSGTSFTQSSNVSLAYPAGLAMGPDGSLYVSDPILGAVFRAFPDGSIARVAGNGASGFDAPVKTHAAISRG